MTKYVFILSMMLFSAQIVAHDFNSDRVDAHAPIGVMGDHTHPFGDMMFSYRYMTMSMDGNRSGNSEKSVSEVLDEYMVSPLDMTMDMHMFGGMIAPTEKLTLMLMAPYISQSMDHRKRDLTEFTRESDGLGDVKVTGLYQLFNKKGQTIHLNLGMSLPMGSIDETDGQTSRLPYPMQLGSGTHDVLLGATYVEQGMAWSGGSQLSSVIRLGKNKHDYALGNRYSGTAWLSKVLTESFSASIRGEATIWNDIRGEDTDLTPSMVPTAETNNGGKRLDLAFGLNYYAKKGLLKGHRLAIELGKPIIQSLDSIQLETDWWVSMGWQYKI
jgi:hypothetical protein